MPFSACCGSRKSRKIGSSACSVTIDGAGADILAEIDGANAEPAGEGRAQGLLRDHRLLLRDLRLGALQIGEVGVDRRLARGVQLQLRLIAPQIDAGELGGGL